MRKTSETSSYLQALDDESSSRCNINENLRFLLWEFHFYGITDISPIIRQCLGATIPDLSTPRFDIELCRIKKFLSRCRHFFQHSSSPLSFLYAVEWKCWMHSGFIAWYMYSGRWIQFNPKRFFISSVQTSQSSLFKCWGIVGSDVWWNLGSGSGNVKLRMQINFSLVVPATRYGYQ